MKGAGRGRRGEFWKAKCTAVVLPLCVAGGCGLSAAQTKAIAAAGQVRAVRAIDDPCTGKQWLLVRDASHPGGPGRLTLAASEGGDELVGWLKKDSKLQLSAIVRPAPPVIRGGDRLVVEEHTDMASVHLEAIALGPAAPGDSLKARLAIGARVVRVVAIAAGRAQLAPRAWGRP